MDLGPALFSLPSTTTFFFFFLEYFNPEGTRGGTRKRMDKEAKLCKGTHKLCKGTWF